MRLVPRQLRQSSFPSSVPYYGGRLTPAVIAGIGRTEPPAIPVTGGNQPLPGTAPPRAIAGPPDEGKLVAALDDLRTKGVVSETEYAQLLARVPRGPLVLGPVQVLVVGVGGDDASSAAVIRSLQSLADGGPVRLLDSFVVSATDDGDLDIDDDAVPRSLDLFADRSGAGSDASFDDTSWSLFDAVPAGSRAVVALLEHRWAIPFRDSLDASGAFLRHETWLDADDRVRLGELLGGG